MASSKGTTRNRKMDIAKMADNLYAERVSEDTKAGKSSTYARNPDSRQLYFSGIHDVLTCLDIWLKAGVSPDQLARFMDELHAQTS
jgi:hypothetical protein